MQKVKLLPIIRSLISTRGWVGCSGALFLTYLPKPRYHAKSKLNSATLLSNLFFLLFFFFVSLHIPWRPPSLFQKADTNNSLIMISLWFQIIQSLKPNSFFSKALTSFIKSNGIKKKKQLKHKRKVMGYSRLVKCLVHVQGDFLKHMQNTPRQAGLSKAALSVLCGSQIIWLPFNQIFHNPRLILL